MGFTVKSVIDNNGKVFTMFTASHQLRVYTDDLSNKEKENIIHVLRVQSGLDVRVVHNTIIGTFSSQSKAIKTVDFLPLGTVYEVVAGSFYLHDLMMFGA